MHYAVKCPATSLLPFIPVCQSEARSRSVAAAVVGFTAWANPEEALAFRLVLRAIEKHGNPSVPLPQGPPFFSLQQHG